MYLNIELAIQRDGNRPDFAKVTKRLRYKAGMPIDRAHNNPIMDTRMYEVEYKDGNKALLEANAIADNIFYQDNGEGNCHDIFQEIIDHMYNGTKVKEQDAFITSRTKKSIAERQKKWVEILIKWKDGRKSWANLRDMKNSHPVQLTKYAVQRRIAGDHAFAWWIWHVLLKCNHIIGNLKSKYWV